MEENEWVKFVLGGIILICIVGLVYFSGIANWIGVVFGQYWWIIIPLLLIVVYYLSKKEKEVIRKPLDTIKVVKLFMEKQSTGRMLTLDIKATNWDKLERMEYYGKLVLRGVMMFKSPNKDANPMPITVTWIFDRYNNNPNDDNASEIFFYTHYLDDKEVERICKIGTPPTKVEGAVEELKKAKAVIKEFEEAKEEVEE